MKLNKYLSGLLAVGMLTACSDDDVTPGNGPTAGFEGDGYIAVSINLPTTTGMARGNNDVFDDGTDNEYEVHNAALLLFVGTSESAASFNSAYDLGKLEDGIDDTDNDNITTSYLKAVKVENLSLSDNDKLYGLVMINYNDDLVKINAHNVSINKESFTGTFNDLLSKTTSQPFYSGLGKAASKFFMTNSPLSTEPGGLGADKTKLKYENIQTLVELSKSLKSTEDEAKAQPAGSIYVERGVAKATATVNAKTLGITGLEINGETAESSVLEIDATQTQWILGNCEPTSYIVRNLGSQTVADAYLPLVNSTNNYRFVGNVAMGVTSIQPEEKLYRTYFCVYPTYGGIDETSTQFAPTTGSFQGVDQPLYCYENTFDVAHQNYRNTTRAVFKIVYKLGDDAAQTFYTVNDIQDKLYTTAAAAESFSKNYVLNDNSLKQAMIAALKDGQKNVDITKYIDIKFERNSEGYRVVKSVDFVNIDEDVFASTPEFDFTDLIGDVNKTYKIAEYTNGTNYYDVRFKHFGDELTPWNIGEDKKATSTDEAYGEESDTNRDANYLGRYGMVRNNWYDVTVTSVKRLGTPEPPKADVDTPDDNQNAEKWISFRINILSWAKRTQSVEF